ncbi:MAG: hypothetical protein A2W35_22130 [Chloroflexi bacterium RBG_16_57_11]|nr:MAG: hypothetical protein A2W35_22130 [Chloroflexi bacterium RBG_16_57_11]
MNTRSKLLHMFTMLVLLLAAFPVMSVAAKPKVPKTDKKVVFCHRKGKGKSRFVRINVSKKSTKAHLKHGDGYPGQAVPGMEGKWFDEACKVVEATRVTSEPITLEFEQWGTVSCPAGYSVVGGGYEGATSSVLYSQPAEEGIAPYPTYTFYIFTPPEEGWAVQNGPDTQTLTIYADCLPTAP